MEVELHKARLWKISRRHESPYRVGFQRLGGTPGPLGLKSIYEEPRVAHGAPHHHTEQPTFPLRGSTFNTFFKSISLKREGTNNVLPIYLNSQNNIIVQPIRFYDTFSRRTLHYTLAAIESFFPFFIK